MKVKNGSDILINTLSNLGVKYVFGLPGTQNFQVYESLRKSSIRTVLATNELNASFMINGYYRISGKVGVLLTIAGPGFTYALTGLAEAKLDSVGLLHIVCKADKMADKAFQLQDIDEKAISTPLIKKFYYISELSDLRNSIKEAYNHAESGEPGPVIVNIPTNLLKQIIPDNYKFSDDKKPTTKNKNQTLLNKAYDLIQKSRKPILYLGQGASFASEQIYKLVELINVPVLTTTSGRGTLAENHPLAIVTDLVPGRTDIINEMFDAADLVIALGCKFSQNGSIGYSLKISPEKLIHVDSSTEVLNTNYPALLAIQNDISVFLDDLLNKKDKYKLKHSDWDWNKIDMWKSRLAKNRTKKSLDPILTKFKGISVLNFFQILSDKLSENSCLITDSGLHQMLTRKYFKVASPRGLIVPSDFQSMGFGIPAAIGAKLATPDINIVVITGDGGFAITGMELITAIRENIDLKIIVFNDKNLGLIRLQQLNTFGYSYSVKTGKIDLSVFCKSIDIVYFKLEKDINEVLNKFLKTNGVCLLEVELKDSFELVKRQLKNRLKNKFLSH